MKTAAKALLKVWNTDPRWKGVKRPYLPEQVLQLQGSLVEQHTLARAGGAIDDFLEVHVVDVVEHDRGRPGYVAVVSVEHAGDSGERAALYVEHAGNDHVQRIEDRWVREAQVRVAREQRFSARVLRTDDPVVGSGSRDEHSVGAEDLRWPVGATAFAQ